jgi:large subunit ribosomal protein L17
LKRSLARSLILHERISTTEAKAKELRPFIERLVTHAKKDTVASRRLVMTRLGSQEATKKLFATIAPRYKERRGGYTRIIKRTKRGAGDASKLAYIAFV